MTGSLTELLESAAEETPQQTAVLDAGTAHTYAELEADSNAFARALVGIGLSRGDRVGLLVPKSYEALVAIYGILKAGAAYVPLDPDGPAARAGLIAADCALRAIVIASQTAPTHSVLEQDGDSIEYWIGFGPSPLPDSAKKPYVNAGDPTLATAPLGLQPGPGDLAYILYTSGSTGRPKGVMLTHENGRAFVDWAVRTLGVRSDDRLSSHAPFHFDLSIFDIFASAAVRATLVLIPTTDTAFPVRLRNLIESEGITIWYSVPSALTMLVTRGALERADLSKLRCIVFAGEVFPTKHLRLLRSLVPDARLFNWYGPTETNVCTSYEVTDLPPDEETIPIGVGIDPVELFVLKGDTEVPIGEVGELCVAGPTVMAGYWGDPDRTARAMARLSRGGDSFDAYRTGDLVVTDDSGSYRLIGRTDHQIKSRGFRIELGEIETLLNSHPNVLESCVVAVPDADISNRLVAFLSSDSNISSSEVSRHLSAALPHYMVPERFETMDSLPKTPTGKIDRTALENRAKERS